MGALFKEFPPVTTEQWLEVVQRDLKGADFNKLISNTLDGVLLKPFYRSEDLPADLSDGVRGDGRQAMAPVLREEVREANIDEANLHAIRCLENGATELAIQTYPIGPAIRTQSEMQRFTRGIWIDAVPIHWVSGPLSMPTLALLANEAERRGLDPSALQGSVDFDPILDRCAGWMQAPMESWRSDFATALTDLHRLPHYGFLTLRGALFEKAGASLAQELAFTLNLLVEYLYAAQQEMGTQGLAELVRRTEIRFGVGTNYFLEIAKLRAAKLLVRNVLEDFGLGNVRPRFHAITTSSNKTLFDPHNNLIRATVETMALVIAGVDSFSVAAYDQGYGAPDEFSSHLSRNTRALLLEEAHLGKVADPLGGSYTVEALTHEYAKASWKLFTEVEDRGGFVAAWESGFIANELHRVQGARQKQVSSHRRTIVGTTVYANPKERRIGDVHAHTAPRQVTRAEPGKLEELQVALVSGKSLKDFELPDAVPSTALDPFRPSWPFEHLRLRVERHVVLGGKRPVILLALFGDKKMRRARCMFVQSFFSAAGYDVREETVASPEDLVEKAEALHPDRVVLCSSDPEYLPFAQQLNIGATVIVAGNPTDTLEGLKAAGVDDFIHLRLNHLETLESYHTKFNIPPIPLDQPLNPETK